MALALSDRLMTAAEFVRSDCLTVDVGTDHGYLSAFLVMSGKTEKVIASDIGEGPLLNAKKTVEKYVLEKNIQLVLSDGLQNITPDANEIIIAGMGGTLISDILEKSVHIKKTDVHLILQPMTHSYDVRKFLCLHGFYIDAEKTCYDDGRVYVVISAYKCDEADKKDEFYYHFGNIMTMENDLDRSYIVKRYKYLVSRYNGLIAANRDIEADYYRKLMKNAEEKFGL